MEESVLGILLMIAVITLLVTTKLVDNTYKKGHEEGWKDCYQAYKQFEMSEDDDLVLDIMKKAIKEHTRRKKYVKEEDRKALSEIKDFEQLKHYVFLTCVYRKEMGNRK